MENYSVVTPLIPLSLILYFLNKMNKQFIKYNKIKVIKRNTQVIKNNVQVIKFLILTLFLIVFLTLAIPKVIISGNIKIAENNIAELNYQINSEQIKNSLMEREYIRKTSYSVIHQKAIEAGMVEAQIRVNVSKHSIK